MYNYRYFFLKELPLYGLLVFITTKVITAAYIQLHNVLEQEQWPYHLLFRNQEIVKNIENLISPIVLAPLFETLFFCVIVYRLCHKVRISGYYYVFVSASFFSLFHLFRDGAGWYTLTYTFVGGLVFAYFYSKKNAKHGENVAYFFTCLIHSFSNFLSVYI